MQNGIEYILETQKLKYSKLQDTNDPYEFYKHNPTAIGSKSSDVNKALETGIKMIQLLKNNCRLACFSIDNIDNIRKIYLKLGITNQDQNVFHFYKGYSKCRMWAQYAERHRGICIVFNRLVLNKEIKNYLNNTYTTSPKFFIADKITYDDNLNDVRNAYIIDTDKDKIKNEIDKVRNNLNPYFYKKIRDFEHEQEYRIVFYSKDISRDEIILVPFSKQAIEVIIIGTKFPRVYNKTVLNLSKKLDCKCYKIDWNLYRGIKLNPL